MRHQLSVYLDNAITSLLLVVMGVTPLLLSTKTTEFYEIPKLIFLVITTTVLLGLWIISWIVKGKATVIRTPLDIPLLLLLGALLVSAYFSESRYTAIFGNFPRVHGSAISWVTYILLFFVTVSSYQNLLRVKSFLYVLYGSGVLIAVISLLSFFSIFFPFDFSRSVTFTPTGSSFSTIAFLMLLLPLPLFSLLRPNKYMKVPLSLFFAVLFGMTIALMGSAPSYGVLFIVFVLCLIITKQHKMEKNLALFFIPVGIIGAILVLAHLPILGDMNKLQQMTARFPKEIQVPLSHSWQISASAFRDAPFIGSGPSTYLFNFTNYKPLEFNQLPFWNTSFDTAYNEFLQILGTIGIFGFVAIIAVCIIVLNTSRTIISSHDTEIHHDSTYILRSALAVSGIVSILLLAIHATTLVSIFATVMILAALMVSRKSVHELGTESSDTFHTSRLGKGWRNLFPFIAFGIFLAGAVLVFWKTPNIVRADYYHRKALSQAANNGSLTYEYLQKAEALNPHIDLYRVDMAQTNFALANAIATQKGPTEANPEGTLTDRDKQTIQTLISQALNESRASVALSPRSARNWEVLAAIYRNITGVAENALTFSLDAYGRAIERDPYNPTLRLSVGGIYYSMQNYDMAIRFFSDAANLKPDYANAFYNLSIALRDSGDLQNAKVVAERAVALLQKDSSDYATAVNLLEDLHEKIATGSAETAGEPAPASKTGSALEDINLSDRDANGIERSPQVATPSAVRDNPRANLPQITPSSSPEPDSE